MKAMIFAAGFGKRLLPLTQNTPKPLVKVKNKPVLGWIIEQLRHYRIDEAVVNTHYLADQLVRYLEEGQFGIAFTFSHETTILGTGGGLFHTIDFWDDEAFYLCNSDILCTADLNDFFSFHSRSPCLATLAVNNRVSNSMLLIDGIGNLVGIQKNGVNQIRTKPDGKIKPVGFCGLHVVNPEVFGYFGSPPKFSIIDEYLQIVSKGGTIKTWSIGDAYWADIGSEEGLENANRHFPGFGV